MLKPGTFASLMNNHPDICHHIFENNLYSIIASDGFWDVIKNEQVDQLVDDSKELSQEYFTNKYPLNETLLKQNLENYTVQFCKNDSFAQTIAKRLLYYAVCHKGSLDNTTVIFIQKYEKKDLDKIIISTEKEEKVPVNNTTGISTQENEKKDLNGPFFLNNYWHLGAISIGVIVLIVYMYKYCH
jgi:serine/threonine protein phosphatase PrpC